MHPTLGVESRLVTYLNDGTAVVTDESWFDFDRLLFDTGKATLQPQSQEQLGNIAAILKAYPNVKVRIGGYTDNTGDAAANVTLSQARADNVVAELVKLGVDPARIEAKGYGQEHPVADNATRGRPAEEPAHLAARHPEIGPLAPRLGIPPGGAPIAVSRAVGSAARAPRGPVAARRP